MQSIRVHVAVTLHIDPGDNRGYQDRGVVDQRNLLAGFLVDREHLLDMQTSFGTRHVDQGRKYPAAVLDARQRIALGGRALRRAAGWAQAPAHDRERTAVTDDAGWWRILGDFDGTICTARCELPEIAGQQVRPAKLDLHAVAQVHVGRARFAERRPHDALPIPTTQDQVAIRNRRRRADGRPTRHLECERQRIGERHRQLIGVRVRLQIRQMSTRCTEFARIIADLHEVALVQEQSPGRGQDLPGSVSDGRGSPRPRPPRSSRCDATI